MKNGRKKQALLVGLSVTMGLLLTVAVVYAAISTTYEHWADADMEWQANILSVGKANYAEGEVIPHFFQTDKLVTGTVYYFDIEYDFWQPSSEACGFWQFNTWNLDRNAPPNPNSVYTETQFSKPDYKDYIPEFQDGQLWYANVSDIEVSYLGEDLPQKYVRVVYTPTNYTLPVEFYWGLQIGYSGQCDEPGVISDSLGATFWTGGSLQTSIKCGVPVAGPAGADCQGTGSLQADPSGIRPTAIAGYKWFDANGNGLWDALLGETCTDPPATGCEAPLEGWEIQAFLCPDATCATWPTTIVVSDTTNLQGQYTLTDLTSGSYYRVCEVLEPDPSPAVYVQTFPNPLVDFGCSPPILVERTLTTRQDFGNWLRQTAVTLESFEANQDGNAIKLVWSTGREEGVTSYKIYRSKNKNEKFMKYVDSVGLDFSGFGQYEFVDDGVKPGKKYYYWLEAVYIGESNSEFFGPVRARVQKAKK